ncbi:MAG: hypothetical protein JWP29_4317 [Rhodoferax sp.]|nr:hypothetical protein [Rhodoferax sp.]
MAPAPTALPPIKKAPQGRFFVDELPVAYLPAGMPVGCR